MTKVPAAFSHITKRQDQFSVAYIRAVAAAAGCTISVPEVDDDKIDIIVSSRARGKRHTKPKLDLQIKSVTSGPAVKETFSYSVDVDTYDALRDTMCAIPRLLVVVLLPRNYQLWMSQSHDNLTMQHCGYWHSLLGARDIRPAASTAVQISRDNIFGPRELQAMMRMVADGLDIGVPLSLGAEIE